MSDGGLGTLDTFVQGWKSEPLWRRVCSAGLTTYLEDMFSENIFEEDL